MPRRARRRLRPRRGRAGEEDDIEIDESIATMPTFIEEEEEGDEDVSDIIGDGIEKEEES